MNEPAVYVPVPVEAARQIGQQCHKDIVVVISIDDAHQLTHTTTWGRSVDHKQLAAALGDHLTKAAGGDLRERIRFADFRARSAAEAAQQIDQLSQEVRDLRELITDATEVAIRKHCPFGLCDQIDNYGNAYQSQWAAEVIRRIKEQPLA